MSGRPVVLGGWNLLQLGIREGLGLGRRTFLQTASPRQAAHTPRTEPVPLATLPPSPTSGTDAGLFTEAPPRLHQEQQGRQQEPQGHRL